MATIEHINIEGYLDTLRSLSFTAEVKLEQYDHKLSGSPYMADAAIGITTSLKTYRLLAEYKPHVSRAVIDRLINSYREGGRKETLILLAPYISSQMAQYLDDMDINFADLEGNCRLSLGRRYYVLITGKRRRLGRITPRGIRAAGYQVIFALLADPSLVGATVRDVAKESGVSKSTVSNWLRQLEEEGFIGKTRSGLRIMRHDELMDRWLEGYKSIVKPNLIIGRYQTPFVKIDERENTIERTLNHSDKLWAWGGLSAAWRILKYYRDDTTILHGYWLAPRFFSEIRALQAADGHLIVLKSIGSITFRGARPHTVHPLLIYTQLLTSKDERARETALELKDRFQSEEKFNF